MNQNTKTAKKRELQIIRSTINPPSIRRTWAIPLQDNCGFYRILLQVLAIRAKFICWHCCISSIITNLHALYTQLHNYNCWALRGSLNLMAPNFELCCLLYRNIIGNQMIRFTVWHKAFHTFFRQILFISEWHWHIFDFKSQETNRTKILQKLWCARLKIGVEDVKGDKGTLTYPSAFFLPLVFEKSSQSFNEYSTVTFGFAPCALTPTGYRKRAETILLRACSDIKRWLLNW